MGESLYCEAGELMMCQSTQWLGTERFPVSHPMPNRS